MKWLIIRLVVALVTFTIGVSLTRLASHPETPTTQQSAWRVLLSFEGADLTKLDDESKARLRLAVEALLGKRDDFESRYLAPRLISKISDSRGEVCYVFIEEFPLVTIPGNSGLHVHQFKVNGRLLRSTNFSVGYRMGLSELRVQYQPEIDRDVVKVITLPVFREEKQFEYTQYYALIDENLLLLRSEDSKGHLVRNNYNPTHFTIGETLTGRSAEDWELALTSKDSAQVLAALTWLSGTHRKPNSPQLGPTDEELSEALLVNKMRLSSGVDSILKTLRDSENGWIREAASSALKSEYY